MPRSKAEPSPPAPAKKSAKRAEAEANDGAAFNWRPIVRRRARALVALGVVALLAWAGHAAWRHAAPSIVGRERYLLPADAITITPAPEWIVADVRAQVVHAAGLDKRLSVLDEQFAQLIESAFALHPWVKSVDRIEKSYPPAVKLSLTYRQPVAAIETPAPGGGSQLLPVDERGVHLPADDVPLIRREHLPRITNIAGQPPEGQTWDDARVPGAVEIALGLAKVWEAWHLLEIVPSTRVDVQDDRQFYVYKIVTRGGTHINWGAAPMAHAPGEAAFSTKLERLKRCVEKYGPLNTVEAPGTVNVRNELEVSPRMVKDMPKSAEPETLFK